ncbi:MAG: hypothetical protein KC502_11470 [Myxococcales bacterium]|nr:hypothetical protein [Myxococcales bacterium]
MMARRGPLVALHPAAIARGFAWSLIAVVGVLSGCGQSTTSCASGTVQVGDLCVPTGPAACGAGTVWDEATKRCVISSADASASTDTAHTDAGPESDAAATDAGSADTGADPIGECKPNCGKHLCGSDGCGGSCGSCPNGKVCDFEGVCHAPPSCLPTCTSKVCGDDGCGGSCGTCGDAAKPICKDGACLAGCVPSCVGKTCGPDGCGGTCGKACASTDTCSEHGHCVPKAWTCGADSYAAMDGCDCGCGVPDPDCKVGDQLLKGCAADQKCDAGKCVSALPKGWSCPSFFYDDGLLCNCACGGHDPDCDKPTNTVIDCKPGGCDKKAGVCGICKPNCTGKVCGDDGCGGSCGTCKDPKLPGCAAGVCVAKCTPDCAGKACGADGCGGTCGSCQSPLVCGNGTCVAEAGKSCASHCGYQTQGGCWCDAGCKKRGDCCADIGLCMCTPDCKGKTCGPDGCGGLCGGCSDKSKPYCDGGTCTATCKPQCTGKSCGPDGCGGSCGTCGKGQPCNDLGTCVPELWSCAPHLYGTGGQSSTCDCSCGSPDPDCKGVGPTVGCPGSAACATGKAVCDATWCVRQGDCKSPAWCVGAYPTAGNTLRGVCAPPNPAGYAPGHPCGVNAACASGLCVGGTCRIHCMADKDCPSGQACTGFERVQPLTGKPVGVVGVCDTTKTTGKSCAKHAECGQQLCLAYVDPAKLGLVARCGTAHGGAPEGAKCADGAHCQLGLVCAAGVCGRPCVGGQADCPSGQTCKPAVLQHGATAAASDDTVVPTCHAKP